MEWISGSESILDRIYRINRMGTGRRIVAQPLWRSSYALCGSGVTRWLVKFWILVLTTENRRARRDWEFWILSDELAVAIISGV